MTVSEIRDMLNETPLFEGLHGTDEVITAYPPMALTVPAGERYEVKNSLVLFMSGKADIVKESETRTAYMKSVNDRSLLGLATLFSAEEEYISTLVAKTDVALLLFSEDFVTALVKAEPEFSLRLVKLLCQKVRYLNRRIDFYTCTDAEEKVREFLIRSSDAEGTVVMSMSRLSETLGIARASLYRAIAALEEKGYIIKNGKKIQLIK